MRLPEDIIIKPYITEKTNGQIALGTYTFVVDVKSSKAEIRLAVEKLFGVKVLSVNTVNREGKKKRMGVHLGNRPKWKKAMVKIDLDPKPETYKTKGGVDTATGKKYKKSIEEFGAVY
jgi:large subunit ribosomal protein L23